MMLSYDHESYLSPLTWRYGSEAMRHIWSEAEKRRLLRRFWVALAEAQADGVDTSLPIEVVVLNCCVTETKDTPA